MEDEQSVLKDPHVKHLIESLRWCDGMVTSRPSLFMHLPTLRLCAGCTHAAHQRHTSPFEQFLSIY